MDTLLLPVTYKNKDHEFPVKLIMLGFTKRFYVLLEGTEVIFECDEQGDFRAMLPNPADMNARRLPEAGLLQAVIESLDAISSR